MRDGLSLRAAADVLGVKHPRVAALKREGRIAILADGSLCPRSVKALAGELSARKAPRQAKSGNGNGNRRPVTVATQLPPIDPDHEPDDDFEAQGLPAGWSGINVHEAVRRKETAAAYRGMVLAQREAGALVPADDVLAGWLKIVGAVRERLLALPSRAATKLGLDRDQERELERMLHEALAALSAEGG